MAMDVALNAAMRANLLTLQTTQSTMDSIQFRLASGRKVNSALDGPQAFFAAQALTNRANDLSRLLDAMGQNISAIKQADKGVTSLTKLVEQADAIANQALTAGGQGSQQATLSGTVALTKTTQVKDIAGIDAINGFVLKFNVTDANGKKVGLSGSGSVTIAQTQTVEGMIAQINALTVSETGLAATQALDASLDTGGKLQIKSLVGGDLRIAFTENANGQTDLTLAKALGFGNAAAALANDDNVAGTTEVALTAIGAPSLISKSLRTLASAGNDVASASTTLEKLVNSSGVGVFSFVTTNTESGKTLNATADLQIKVNNGTAVTIGSLSTSFVEGISQAPVSSSSSIQSVVDTINSDSSLKSLIQASYDETTGELSIRSISSSVETIQFGAQVKLTNSDSSNVTTNETGNFDINELGFGTGVAGDTYGTNDNGRIRAYAQGTGAATATGTTLQNFLLGTASGELARLEKDFNSVRSQIDQLVADSGYQGINLLNGDNLTTVFNQERTSSLTTVGKSFTSDSLGVNAANFGTTSTISTSLSQVRSALGEVRNFGSTLANDLSVIQIRQEFTKETINTLSEGSDKLTLADQNEEGAKMLATQTRQQLGVVSLSLASQAAQSVLRLF